MNKVIHIIENGQDKGITDKYCKKVKLDKDYDAKEVIHAMGGFNDDSIDRILKAVDFGDNEEPVEGDFVPETNLEQ